MGDMGDFYRDIKEYNREKNQERLEVAKANCPVNMFRHLTPYHWQTTIQLSVLNYWPSTGKWSWKAKQHTGTHQDLLNFIKAREQ